MTRNLPRNGPDPLLLFLLAAIGVSEVGACGGVSQTRQHGSADGADGVDGERAGSGGMRAVGASGAGGVAAASGQAGNGSDIRITGSGAGGMAPLDPPPSEGVVGCTMPAPYPAPYPLPDPPPDTGFFVCQTTGVIHRAAAQACPAPFADPGPAPDGCPSDNDCKDVPNGRCLPQNATACRAATCLSECQSDSDCQANELCLCDAEINHCVPASCRSDAECGEGLLCISSSLGIGRTPFACQTTADECTASCPSYNTTSPNGVEQHLFGSCALTVREDGSHQRTCSYANGTGGTCGRPFLVEGVSLVAEAVRRGDWLAAVSGEPRLEAMKPELRSALAASWREAALMEHASIAAFARFSLELLALGAPAELVGDAARAMADEQQHAELCFTLASAYAGAPLGPGPLDVKRCLSDVSLEAVLFTTFLEGCLGETLAAVEARERARHVLDPVLEAALLRIAEDESRHAALAWRFVQWAFAHSGADAGTLFTALEKERARHLAADALPSGVSEELARAHALLPAAERSRLRLEVLDEIVAPCLRALGARRANDTAAGTSARASFRAHSA